MMRVFIDASVIFAAAYSATGASREVIRQGIRGQIDLVASALVFEEARRNLEAKAPEAASSLEIFRAAATFEMVRPSREEIEEMMEYTAVKDAPVVAAARKAQVDCLVSLDRAHLVGVSRVVQGSGLTILLPGDLLKEMRASEE
jgi:predicted nucleic acid-binding protein